MKELNNIETLFIKSIIDAVPEGGEHKFSLRYKLRKRIIIRNWERGHKQSQSTAVRPAVKLKYILIAVLIAAAAILTGFGIFDLFDGFRVTDYDIYSMLYIVDDLSVYPDTIEEKFYIDMDMSGYETKIANDTYFEYWIRYNIDTEFLSITQKNINYFGSARLNAEEIIAEPIQIIINGWNGVYYQTKDGEHYYIFNTGKYIITYAGNMNKNEIENIVKATKID